MIGKCRDLYKYIDYLHDRRLPVPLKYKDVQPPKCILNAILFKMKADQMRLIYECLSGENGLLYGQEQQQREVFAEFIKNKDKKEIAVDDDFIDCELCNKNFDPEADFPQQWTREDRDNYYKQPMTLLEFMEHEVYHEYEKAKRAIFDKDMTLAK